VWYRGRSGWQGGFEQEPLVWGYGLNGGYVLGEAARPFPRLRVESPMAELNAGPIPLGRWGFQAFMGRLEDHRVLSSSMQDLSWRTRAIASQGDVQAPLLMGYRAQATFGPWLEFYMNMTDLWSGTLNGRGMTQGYSLSEYLTAMTGFKDTLAEANTDFSDPGHPTGATYKNGARSASEADVGFRAQLPFLARSLSAQTAHFYISRGSKTMIWPLGLLAKRPLYYMGKDATSDARDTIPPNPGAMFNKQSRYLLPSLAFPNNTVGLLVAWPKLRAAFEYFDGTNPANQGARPFTHGQYLTGFYYQGDPLGNAVGGEATTFTAKLEADFTPRVSGSTTVMRGSRPFRDNLTDWQSDHPGQSCGTNSFTGLQQSLAWKAGAITTLSVEAAWQRQTAVNYVAGNEANGLAWYTDVAFRWPARR
jgi:hypothetical protein